MDGFVYDDGGRAAAGFKSKHVGDCVARAIAIASGRAYTEVYARLADGNATQRASSHSRKASNFGRRTASDGIWTSRKWLKDYMAELGFRWVPTMRVGQGCTVHLLAEELPAGRLVIKLSRHLTAMIDGVIHDAYDPRREVHCTEPYREPVPAGYWSHDKVFMHHVERRCVYGYWTLD